jgi:hypothetical protein
MVSAQAFTAWHPPSSIENSAWRAAHRNWSPASWDAKATGRGSPVTEAKALPKIRYHLITKHEFNGFDGSWLALRRWLPSLIKQQQFVDVGPSYEARIGAAFIRPRDIDVPACD